MPSKGRKKGGARSPSGSTARERSSSLNHPAVSMYIAGAPEMFPAYSVVTPGREDGKYSKKLEKWFSDLNEKKTRAGPRSNGVITDPDL